MSQGQVDSSKLTAAAGLSSPGLKPTSTRAQESAGDAAKFAADQLELEGAARAIEDAAGAIGDPAGTPRDAAMTKTPPGSTNLWGRIKDARDKLGWKDDYKKMEAKYEAAIGTPENTTDLSHKLKKNFESKITEKNK